MGSVTSGSDEPSPQPAAVDDRDEIVISTDEAVVNNAAIRALRRDVSLFQRGGKLVHVVRDSGHGEIDRPMGAPRVVPISLAGLRERLTGVAKFVTLQSTKDGEQARPEHPPKWCYEAIAARGEWSGIRCLSGVVTAPVLRPDGSVLNLAGHDPQTGLLFDPQGVTFPVVGHPSRKDALRATANLLDLVTNFPFSKPEHRAAWLAFLLTPLARFAFAGPAPLFLVDANIRGSGKSLLCDVVSLIVTGREMPRMSNPESDGECRKRITSVALAGDTLCLIDNIDGDFGCPSLDAALTSTVWQDRLMGTNETPALPLFVTWCATGNNVVLIGDTSRRVAHIRLNSPLESPEQRDDLKHEDLKSYVRQHRPGLLADALTILAAFCRTGCPQQKLPTWGSFEDWSDLVRQAIVWCGQPDPVATRTELVKRADREAAALPALVNGWDELDPDRFGVTATEIISRLSQHPDQYEQVRSALMELCPPKDGGLLPSVGSLGKKLGHLRGRVVCGRFIDSRDNRSKVKAWFVCGEAAGDDGDAGDNSDALTREVEGLPTREPIGKVAELSPASPASPASGISV